MNTVQRTKGIRKIVRKMVFGETVPRYMVSGDRACRKMMRESRPQRQHPGPSDSAILAWAKFDLTREVIGGFWDLRAA